MDGAFLDLHLVVVAHVDVKLSIQLLNGHNKIVLKINYLIFIYDKLWDIKSKMIKKQNQRMGRIFRSMGGGKLISFTSELQILSKMISSLPGKISRVFITSSN